MNVCQNIVLVYTQIALIARDLARLYHAKRPANFLLAKLQRKNLLAAKLRSGQREIQRSG